MTEAQALDLLTSGRRLTEQELSVLISNFTYREDRFGEGTFIPVKTVIQVSDRYFSIDWYKSSQNEYPYQPVEVFKKTKLVIKENEVFEANRGTDFKKYECSLADNEDATNYKELLKSILPNSFEVLVDGDKIAIKPQK